MSASGLPSAIACLYHADLGLRSNPMRQDGSSLHTHLLMVSPEAEDVEGHVCFIQDVTQRVRGEEERRRLEQQLRHSQLAHNSPVEETGECDECGEQIRTENPSMVNVDHAESCSLYPSGDGPA